jgi:hypothetical protein
MLFTPSFVISNKLYRPGNELPAFGGELTRQLVNWTRICLVRVGGETQLSSSDYSASSEWLHRNELLLRIIVIWNYY